MMLDSDSQSDVKIDFGMDFGLDLGQAELWISAESDVNKNSLLQRSQNDCLEFGEESIQLLEGYTYEYELPQGYSLKPLPNIVQPFKRNKCGGRITPKIYVGRLVLVIEKEGSASVEVAVEVRSIKANYRDEYRTMLEDITNECTELLMLHSPVTQHYSVDYSAHSATLYQRFSFVKSIVDSVAFRHAIHRVISMPVTAWKDDTEELDIRRSRRLDAKQIRQFGSSRHRIKLSENHPLSARLSSVPSRITSSIKTDTVDTPENRFVKHALKEFERFCGSICRHIQNDIHKNNKKCPAIYFEAKALEDRLSEYLNHSLFRDISPVNSLCLNSPVLQRKQGYREVLRAWLMYDLAAKLIWNALDDDVYNIGKRDVATLYEYWLFFKLLRLVEDIFNIEAKETKQLIEKTDNGLSLKLMSGKHIAVKGVHTFKGREFNIQFNFNRTFKTSSYPEQGSWTKAMRPDYTLSLWPKAFSEQEAEEQELMVHVHFDAKYKVEGLKYLTESRENLTSDDLSAEKNSEKEGVYKRADLLKMHAYKDAIRRTVGAYVLYPGSEVYKRVGFHEIVPGLGAFPVSPSKSNEGLSTIRNFINGVVQHLSDRSSQRDRLSYHCYDIHKSKKEHEINEIMPEYAVNSINIRSAPVAEATVLIGYYHEKQYEWIKKKGLYNIRLDDKGLKVYGTKEAGATYLLLRTKGSTETSDIWEIVSSSPKIMSKSELLKSGYPTQPSCENYLIYSIRFIDKKVFGNKKWDISQLKGYSPNRSDATRPFGISLSELSKVVV